MEFFTSNPSHKSLLLFYFNKPHKISITQIEIILNFCEIIYRVIFGLQSRDKYNKFKQTNNLLQI